MNHLPEFEHLEVSDLLLCVVAPMGQQPVAQKAPIHYIYLILIGYSSFMLMLYVHPVLQIRMEKKC